MSKNFNTITEVFNTIRKAEELRQAAQRATRLYARSEEDLADLLEREEVGKKEQLEELRQKCVSAYEAKLDAAIALHVFTRTEAERLGELKQKLEKGE